MKDIKILELTASNWRSQNFHDIYKDTNYLSGKNGSGKSTRISAWLWLLSGCTDANSPQNSRLFDDKSELTDKTPIASVEAVVSIDGETYKIRREAEAAFQRKRGTNETVKSASDNYFYYIDDISRSATDFKEWISANIATDDMLKFALDGSFFTTLVAEDKKKARQTIEKLVGTVTRDEMQGDYSCIDELLKKFSLDEIDMRCQNLIKGIDQRLNEIPALIRQKEDEISEIEQTDFVAIDKEIDELEQRRTDLDKQMTDLTERIRPQMQAKHAAETKRLMKQDVFDKAYYDWKRSFADKKDRLLSEISAIRKQNEKSQAMYDDAVARKKEAETRQKADIQQHEKYSEKRQRLLKERDEAKAREFDPSSALCPFCGQRLEGEKLQEQIEKFEQRKRDEINRIVIEGKATSEEIKRLEDEIQSLHKAIAEPLPEVISQPIEDLQAKVLELDTLNLSVDNFATTEHGKALKEDIESVSVPKVEMPDDTDIVNAKKEVNERLVPLYEQRGLKTRLTALRNAADELRVEQKEKGAELADLERQRKAVKDFRQEQMEILSRKVNDGLKCSRIEVWSKQKDGNVVPDIVLKDANGVSFQTTNNASRITTTIDLQRFFCEKLGVRMPIWCDEATIFDSNNLPKFDDTQSFYLFCAETSLKIESR